MTPPDRVLLDFGALDSADFDPAKLVRDCDIIHHAALADPDALIFAGPMRRAPSRRRSA